MNYLMVFLFCLLFTGFREKADQPVFAVFKGRTPCQQASEDLGLRMSKDCFKLKWKLTLYHDKDTQAPGTYKIEATFCRQKPRTGTWKITRGIKVNPEAVVYELDFEGANQPLRLYKADDNILFFVRQDGELMPGDELLSYTLNKDGEAISKL